MKRVFVYLQHDNNKPIKIEVKDMDKLRGYLEAGRVKIKEKWYNIITEDIEVMLDWWDEPAKPKMNKSSRVSVDIPTDPYSSESRVNNEEVWTEYKKLKEKVKHLKNTGVWLD